jgi:hypothetical protein
MASPLAKLIQSRPTDSTFTVLVIDLGDDGVDVDSPHPRGAAHRQTPAPPVRRMG